MDGKDWEKKWKRKNSNTTGKNYAVAYDAGMQILFRKMESFQLSTLEPKPPTVSGNQKLKLSQEIEWALKKDLYHLSRKKHCELPIP